MFRWANLPTYFMVTLKERIQRKYVNICYFFALRSRFYPKLNEVDVEDVPASTSFEFDDSFCCCEIVCSLVIESLLLTPTAILLPKV